jgi:UDPglucose--hexose-1-phosphate uridylyltransferase
VATSSTVAGQPRASDESFVRNDRERHGIVEAAVRDRESSRSPVIDRVETTSPVFDHRDASRHVEHHTHRFAGQVHEGRRRIHECSLSPPTPRRQPEFTNFGWQTGKVTNEPSHHLDRRIDPVHGTVVHVVGHRQTRPNLPTNVDTSRCPFCLGGLEAPDPYDVHWFVNRWPALPDDRCEVVLYSPDHDASLASLDPSHVKRLVDVWAERSDALGSRPDVHYVLVFENRGASVGATISHPHGQIYAYDHVPERLARRGSVSPAVTDDRTIHVDETWVSFVPFAPVFPTSVTIAPREPRGRLSDLTNAERQSLARVLTDTCRRLDALFETPLPYMMWVEQQPYDDSASASVMTVEFVSPWRARDLPRYIAAAEVAAGEYFNPVVPEELAERLRTL